MSETMDLVLSSGADVTFSGILAQVKKFAEINRQTVFDYEDKDGNKDARSHVAKLRKLKKPVNDVHKREKEEALETCRLLDGQKREIIDKIEEMIEYHAKPIREKEERDKAAEEAARIEKEISDCWEEAHDMDRAHNERVKMERELAELKAEQERQRIEKEREEREKKIAEDAARQAKLEAEAKAREEKEAAELAVKKAQIEKEEAEKRAAKAAEDAERKVREEQERKEAEERRKKEAEEAERKRKEADLENRKKVNRAALAALEKHVSHEVGIAILGDIINGNVPHVSIKYA